MRILVLADHESRWLWDYFEKDKLEGIDMILSCGDLKAEYLSFLATFFHGPLLYIHGNHDEPYQKLPPEGCICIEDTIFEYNGVRILGLGGSMRYRPGPFQYTEAAMKRRILRLLPRLYLKGGFDILLTHAPAWQVNDGTDLAHTGFKVFRKLIERFSPNYFIHGHMHQDYMHNFKRLSVYQDTIVVNAYEHFLLDISIPADKPRLRNTLRKKKLL